MIEVLDKKVFDFLEADKEGLTKIDWQGLAQLRKNVKSCGEDSIELYNELFDSVLDAFISSGWGSYISEGNFALVGRGMLLNPRFSHPASFTLYFTREQDAREYAKAFYNRSRFAVELFRGVDEKVNN